jgi:hypothetical protein
MTAGKAEADGAAAEYFLEIGPKEPSRNTILGLTMRGFDLADAKVEWLVNGSPAANPSGMQFKCSDARKGDVIQARAVSRGREVRSNEVRIKNTAPEITRVRFLPEGYKPGERFSVDVAGNDPDGDEVTFLYEWTKNGEPAGKTNKIEGDIKRGDKISLKITAFDGEDYGRPRFLNTGIHNMPPVIVADDKFTFDGRVFTYEVKAKDPDGDPLAYSIESPPQGMTIDPQKGLVTWNVPNDFKGRTSFTVAVKDDKGGEASYKLNFSISEPKK